MKGAKAIILVLVWAGVVPGQGAPLGRESKVVDLVEGPCRSGIQRAPQGPFALWISCEDVLGVYVSVVHAGTMGAPREGAWSIGERWWHQPGWGDDVTSYWWDPSGSRLFIATSGIYGEGGVYVLDLHRRVAEQVSKAPNDHGAKDLVEWRIGRLDSRRNELVLYRNVDGRRDSSRLRIDGR